MNHSTPLFWLWLGLVILSVLGFIIIFLWMAARTPKCPRCGRRKLDHKGDGFWLCYNCSYFGNHPNL